jgi:hypothetical protein
MNELDAQVGCPKGEYVIVLIKVKEIYIASPKN